MCPCVARPAMSLFGRHVKWSTEDALSLHNGQRRVGHFCFAKLRETEVEYLHLSLRSDHHIRWFQVPVNHTLFMSFFKCFGDLEGDLRRLFYRERTGPQLCCQRLSRNAFHYDVVDAILLAYVIHRCDMNVAQLCEGQRLFVKTAASILSP